MKKILLIFIILLFSNVCSNAQTVVVKYNNAGFPVSVTYGAGRPVSAYWDKRMQPGYRNPRPIRPCHSPACYNNRPGMNPDIIANSGNKPSENPKSQHQSVSRLNKNYEVHLPQKSYTNGGVTYYN